MTRRLLIGSVVVATAALAWAALLCLPASTPPDERGVAAAMKAQAEELGRALLAEDHARLLAFTLPEVVEEMGGRERATVVMKQTAAGMKAKGFVNQAVSYEDPAGLREAGGNWYGVIPFRLEVVSRGKRAATRSFLVGVSRDGGKSWEFIDGAGLDRGKLKRLLPGFPDSLDLPSRQPPEFPDDPP